MGEQNGSTAATEPANVLVVDDEKVIQMLLRTVLEQDGHTVHLATTAAEGLAVAVDAGPFDVALVDKNLPDRSGLEVIRELKQQQRDTEVIIITGYASLDSAIEALQVGAFDYVLKPFEDINDLRVKVRNAVEKRHLLRAKHRLSHELSESEERYLRLFNASPDPIIVYDAVTAKVWAANPAAESLYGYAAEEFRALHAHDIAAPVEPGQRAVTATTGMITRRDVHEDGTLIDVEVTVSAFRLGDRDMLIEVVRDISQRLAEERLREQLELQLRHAQKMEAVGRLAGGVAHDFNNLLVVIISGSELLQDDLSELEGVSAATKEYAAQVAHAGKSAALLTRQLLSLSRKQVVSPEVLDLNDLISRVCGLLERTLRENISLTTVPAPELWPVKIDLGHVEQLLMNLAVNARDAMPTGGTLTVSTSNVELDETVAGAMRIPGGQYVRLVVADTGSGIAPDALPHIFEPFFTTKRKGKGSGLGLATVYGIVERMGGHIGVSSAPGEGAEFVVHLPRTTEKRRLRRASTEASVPGKGETLLLVEDDPGVRTVVRRMLDRASYAVVEASNAEEALVAFQRHGSDIRLVVVDIVLPSMNGIDLVARLQKDNPNLRAVLMSGYAADTIPSDVGAHENAMFLPKPFTEGRLLATVREALDH